jgi:TRAP-type transport system periplasmic protein
MNTLKPTLQSFIAVTLLAAVAATLPARAQDAITLRASGFAPPGTPFAVHWQKFKENIERDTQGAIKVDLNTNDPNEGNLLSNLRRGRVDCVGASLQGSSTILPEVAVLQLPYLFNSFKQVDAAYDKGLTDTYRKLFAAKGVTMLQFVEVGFTHMYGTQPVKTPTDVKGLKLRATQSRASQVYIKATGAEPVVLPIAGVVPGLQTGLIKGGESGLTIYSAFIAKSAPHYTLTSHAFDSGVFLCNKEFFDKLTPAQQSAVTNGWNAREQQRDSRAQNDKFIADAAQRGVTVHVPNAAELQQWRAVGKKAADELLAGLSPEAKKIHDEIVRDIAAVK